MPVSEFRHIGSAFVQDMHERLVFLANSTFGATIATSVEVVLGGQSVGSRRDCKSLEVICKVELLVTNEVCVCAGICHV